MYMYVVYQVLMRNPPWDPSSKFSTGSMISTRDGHKVSGSWCWFGSGCGTGDIYACICLLYANLTSVRPIEGSVPGCYSIAIPRERGKYIHTPEPVNEIRWVDTARRRTCWKDLLGTKLVLTCMHIRKLKTSGLSPHQSAQIHTYKKELVHDQYLPTSAHALEYINT